MKRLITLILFIVVLPLFAQNQHSNTIANKLYNDDYVEIAKGAVTGKTAVNIMGQNHSLAATNETVYEQSDVMGYIAPGQMLRVLSSSANDDSTGTGIKRVTITGLDSSWAAQTTTVWLQGATECSTGSDKYARVFSMKAYSAGSGGVAAGNITLKNNANDTTVATIPTGETSANMAVYTVPTGKTLYVTQLYASTGKNVLTTVSLFARPNGQEWYEVASMQLYYDGFNLPFTIPLSFSALTDLQIRAKGNTSDVVAGFQGWYE